MRGLHFCCQLEHLIVLIHSFEFIYSQHACVITDGKREAGCGGQGGRALGGDGDKIMCVCVCGTDDAVTALAHNFCICGAWEAGGPVPGMS